MGTATSATDTVRQAIGRYEVSAKLFSGALGELWVGRISSGAEAGRVVTVRRIPRPLMLPEPAVSALSIAGFSTMELRHPNVAAVLDVLMQPTELTIVSEHLAGPLLSALLSPGPGRVRVPQGVALRIALDVLSALRSVEPSWGEVAPGPPSGAGAIGHPGIHGGLTPDGILVATYGESMLLEVGMASLVTAIPEIADRAEILAYRAPEQLEGPRRADARSDVFTVGILVWELLVGRTLFGPAPLPPRPPVASREPSPPDRAATSGVRRKVLAGPVQRLDSLPQLRQDVTRECADFVARCLERAPEKRYQSLPEAIEALSRIPGVATHPEVASFLATLRSRVSEPELSPSSARPTRPPEDRQTVAPETRRGEGETAGAARPTAITAPEDPSRRALIDAGAAPTAPLRAALESAPTSTERVSADTISVEPISGPVVAPPSGTERGRVSSAPGERVSISSADVERVSAGTVEPPGPHPPKPPPRVEVPSADLDRPASPPAPPEHPGAFPGFALSAAEAREPAPLEAAPSGAARSKGVLVAVAVGVVLAVVALVGYFRSSSSETPKARRAPAASAVPAPEGSSGEAPAAEGSSGPAGEGPVTEVGKQGGAAAPTAAPAAAPAAGSRPPAPRPARKPYRPKGI